MKSRRVVLLALAVVALVAIAGVASHGRPLAGGRGRGPTPTFFDYVGTTVLLGALVVLAVVVYVLFSERSGGRPQRVRARWTLLSSFVALVGGVLIAVLLLHTGFIDRMRRLEQRLNLNQSAQGGDPRAHRPAKHGRNARLRWDEIGLFVVLIAGTAVVLIATRSTSRPALRRRLTRGDAVSAAIDESIDDLRSDPDLRRAIVAAYARMEQALGRAGLPRRPAEAPFEYVERALGSLETSAASVQRLTALFEWAKFSQHEPRPEMRDEAIEALLAVRDELARPDELAVTA